VFLVLSCISIWLSLSGSTYYISPDGNDSNPGTISQPFYSLSKAWTVVSAGDIVYMRGGIYEYNSQQYLVGKNGTSGNYIKIFAYPGETPVITRPNSSWTYSRSGDAAGIYFEGDYVHFKGIELAGFTQITPYMWSGMEIQRCNHCIFESLNCHDNGVGFILSHQSDDNLILNCDFHHNFDPISPVPYDNADGVSAFTDEGTTNTFRGCRSWNNADDGYDTLGSDGLIIFDNCWSWMSGYKEDGETPGGNGNGFKFGAQTDHSTEHLRTLTNCLAFHNRAAGIAQNGGDQITWAYNNTAYHNADNPNEYDLNFEFDCGTSVKHILRNNISYANQHPANLQANWDAASTQDHNTWNGGVTLNDGDFVSLDTTGVSGPRGTDGELPDLNYLKLEPGSDLIDAGTDVGISYNGEAPDLGAFEFQTAPVDLPAPMYTSSSIENATPSLLEMTYNMTLANIVPATSAFSVSVNSSARSVNTVAISGSKVRLTLASPVIYGNVVKVTYSKPTDNPLQTTAGGEAESINTQTVTNKVNSVNPVYVSSAVENATPSLLEITYNLTLANIVPATSAFSVSVNSTARSVNTVAISGTKVQLTLASPVLYGNVVKVTYTKPANNPLQTAAGVQAESISSQTVTNNVNSVNPVYVSSAIENATPSLLEMTYNLTLANIAPPTSAFSVSVNSTARAVNTVAISGAKVQLTLANPALYGDVVSITYTQPAANPLQTAAGGKAASISTKSVTNNCIKVSTTTSPPVVVINFSKTIYAGFISEIDATSTYDPNNDPLTVGWTVPEDVPVSTVKSLKTQFLAPVADNSKMVDFQLIVSNGKISSSKDISINVLPYKPELSFVRIINIETSDSHDPDYPANILDGNTKTKWSSNGDNNWFIVKFAEPFKISHFEMAFLQGQNYSSYFDIYASKDHLIWEPILTRGASCSFTGDRQIFDVPALNKNTEYLYVKYVGHGNSVNSWNNVSELKIFGSPGKNPISAAGEKRKVIVYPNPASNFLNISIEEPTLQPDLIRIIDFSGKIVYEKAINPAIKNVQVPLSLKSGVYSVDLSHNHLTLFAQKLIVKN
jgi:uncharacterized repeat protein (TIGR02059 family)